MGGSEWGGHKNLSYFILFIYLFSTLLLYKTITLKYYQSIIDEIDIIENNYQKMLSSILMRYLSASHYLSRPSLPDRDISANVFVLGLEIDQS